MKRTFVLVGVMLLVTIFSFATTLTVWFSWEGQKDFQSIVNEFNRSHPNIKVNLVYVPNMIQKLRITLSTGEGFPDLALVRNNDIGLLVDAKAIIPIKNVKTTPSFYKSFLINNVEYAYPYYADVQVVYVNKTLLNDIGMSLPSTDWTLSDLENMASSFKKSGHIGIVFQNNSPYFFNPFNAAFNGGNIPQKDGIPLANTKGTLKAAQLFNYLFNEKKIAVSYKKMAFINAFKSGRSGMMMMGSFLIPDFLNSKLDFSIVPYPSLDNGSPIPPVFDSKGFVFFKKSRAAENFIDYITSTKIEEEFCKQNYKLPANEKAMLALKRSDELFKVMSLSAEKALILPTSKVFKEAYGKAISTALSLYLNDKVPLEEAFSKAQEYIYQHK